MPPRYQLRVPPVVICPAKPFDPESESIGTAWTLASQSPIAASPSRPPIRQQRSSSRPARRSHLVRAMQLSATLTTAELRTLAHSLLPLRIDLRGDDDDDPRWLDVTEPIDTHLIARECLSLSARAVIRWPERAVFDEFNVERVEVRLVPRIEARSAAGDDGAALVIDVRIGAIDVSWVPDFVSGAVVDAVNKRLERAGAELRWDFSSTLSVDFDEPGEHSNIERVCLDLRTAQLDIGEQFMRLEAPMIISVRRRSPEQLAQRLHT
jgi:hypothetical protein